MRRTATLVILALTACPPYPALSDSALPTWLEGCWRRDATGTVMVERWLPRSANALHGVSETRRDGATVAWEFLQIITGGDGTQYVAWPSGQQPTAFERVDGPGGEWVFENPGHDFPQRIVYPEPVDDRLEVRIEGDRGGETRVVRFAMRRVDCADAWAAPAEVEGARQSG
jgi:hypothetical protein